MNFIKYPSIDQYRNVIRQVKLMTSYQGKDEDGNAVYDNSIPMPTLTFKGTVKIHGTNAAVCHDPSTKVLWTQSRKNIITSGKDNAGFALFVESNHESLLKRSSITPISTAQAIRLSLCSVSGVEAAFKKG